MAIDVIFENTRLLYSDRLINSMNKRKKRQLVQKRDFERKHKAQIEKLNNKHKKVLEEYNQKKSINKVAKNLKMGIREVKLVAKLYSYRGGETL